MKNTPLTEKHIALGAKMAEFAGYYMPISYTSIVEEHLAVRQNVGVFDVSHMGEFIVRGRQALDLVQKVTTNDASRLAIGQAQYSCMPNHTGGIVDDLLVYRLPEDMCAEGEMAFMLVVNAANIEKDWNWLQQENTFDARLIDISEETGLIAVQGPRAADILQPLTELDLHDMRYYTFAKGRFAGIDNVLVSATGYTGSGGFEIYARNEDIPAIWDAVFEAGRDHDIKPAGLGARDTLRLEMGYALYGNDIDDTTSPLEAGLGWITKLDKGPFNSREIFLEQKAKGLSRKLVGFVMEERRVPRHDYPILDESGQNIGRVTSGTHSPSLDQPIGMGYVEMPYTSPGTRIFIEFGRKQLPATVTKMPFYKG
ncbi:MAG: aminomethyltransferase [Saprospiraceae bacterium]|nr:MAG: aminomethyltransferase [Saprospiraceae bacterium]